MKVLKHQHAHPVSSTTTRPRKALSQQLKLARDAHRHHSGDLGGGHQHHNWSPIKTGPLPVGTWTKEQQLCGPEAPGPEAGKAPAAQPPTLQIHKEILTDRVHTFRLIYSVFLTFLSFFT